MALKLLIYLEKLIVLCLSVRIFLRICSRKRQGMTTKIRFFSHLEVGLHIALAAVMLLSVYETAYAPFLAVLGLITAVLLWFFPDRIVWISGEAVSVGNRVYPRSGLVSARCGGFCDRIDLDSGCHKIYLPIYEPQIMDALNRKGGL